MAIDISEEYGVDHDYDVLIQIDNEIAYTEDAVAFADLIDYMISAYEHLSTTENIIDDYCVYVNEVEKYKNEYICDDLQSALEHIQYCKKCVEIYCEFAYKSTNRDFALMVFEKDQVNITYPLISLIRKYKEAMMNEITHGFTEETSSDLLQTIKELKTELSRMCRRYTNN